MYIALYVLQGAGEWQILKLWNVISRIFEAIFSNNLVETFLLRGWGANASQSPLLWKALTLTLFTAFYLFVT